MQYGSNSIYLDVDTSSAGFNAVPNYFASLDGDSGHWQLDGINAIYSPTATGFRIYLRDDLGNPMTPDNANDRGWNIQWTGIPKAESLAGSTVSGATNWKQYGSNSIYVDVDTTKAGFSDTPLYFTSIGGRYSQWEVDGASAVYSPTDTGFRIYVRDDLSNYLTPETANQRGWNVQWIGVPKSDNEAGSTASEATNWKQYGSNSIYADVETNKAGFTNTPQYFTSIAGLYNHWEAKGINAIYSPSPTSFRIYLRDDLNKYMTPEIANQREWTVQWAAI